MKDCATCHQPIGRISVGWAHVIDSDTLGIATGHPPLPPCDQCGSPAEPRSVEGVWLCTRCAEVPGADEVAS